MVAPTWAYKAEHTVDLESEIILSATVQTGTEPDSQTLLPAVIDAQANLIRSGSEAEIQEVAADKGYHANEQITKCERFGLRTYIPEPDSPHHRKWTDKSAETKRAVLNNRRRTQRSKSKRLQKQRSEKVERSFAHVCETGGARRTWLRGLEKITKRYSLVVAAHNLGIMLRTLFGSGKPRQFASTGPAFFAFSWLFTIYHITSTTAHNLAQQLDKSLTHLTTT
ncbi:MAG: transposase [Planctomycetaceae bacterium]